MNSIHPDSRTCGYTPWPHRIATVLVCVTFPLIWVGGLVTTYDAGMAVPDWPGTYGYNLFLYPVWTWLAGPWDLFIEHGHRLLASAVGMITILLVLATWRGDDRRWVRGFMLAALGLVIGQGVLGGLRVLLDETLLARLHGCVGPLFFASTVFAAAITSRWWRDAQPTLASPETARFSRLAWFTAVISYAQLVLGAHLRHIPFGSPPTTFRGLVLAHLLVAALLVAHVGMLAIKGLRSRQVRPCRLLRRPLYVLAALLLIQLLLGAATWRLKYSWPSWLPQPAGLKGYTVTAESMLQTVTTTAHVALGSLIVATAVLLAIRSSRLFARTTTASAQSSSARCRLEVLV